MDNVFLGSHIGAIVSCLVTYYVLYKQLEQNHKENSYNRQLQINAIEYQQRTQWLTELKSRLHDLESVFHRSDFDSLTDLFTCDMIMKPSMDYQTKILERINWIFAKVSSAILSVSPMFRMSPNRLLRALGEVAFLLGGYQPTPQPLKSCYGP